MKNRFLVSLAFTGYAFVGMIINPVYAQWTDLVIQTYESSPAATVYYTVQPHDTNPGLWVGTVSWTDVNSGSHQYDQLTTTFAGRDLENSVDGTTLSAPTVRLARQALVTENPGVETNWLPVTSSGLTSNDVGEFIAGGSIYNNKQFGSGWGSVTLLTSVGNFNAAGGVLYFDDDGAGNDDIRFYIGHDPGSYPLGGYFQISGAIAGGQTFGTLFTDLTSTTVYSGLTANVVITSNALYDPIVVAPQVIPEPATLTTLLVLFGGMLVARRRRR